MRTLADLQRDFINHRFGMFICLSPTSYLDLDQHLMPDHAPPRAGLDGILGTEDDLSPALVQPDRLETDQWAAAAQSAGMTYGVFTTKHHDGFCNWPSQWSDYTVAQGCGIDLVREYARAFRGAGLGVGLYYSIRDRTAGIGRGEIDEAKIQLIEGQLEELLTGYGAIQFLLFDAWANDWHESPDFVEVPYDRIYRHIKRLQPECLVINHTQDPRFTDILHFEQNAGQRIQPGNALPAQSGPCLQSRWFWDRSDPHAELKSVEFVVDDCLRRFNAMHANLVLNCAPNREGRMDENVVTRLAEIGRTWQAPPPLLTVPPAWESWPLPN